MRATFFAKGPSNSFQFVANSLGAVALLLLIRTAAATDSEMAQLLETERARLTRMEHNARPLYERGDFREGVTLEQARDILWVYSSPELYELLVLREGWPLEHYGLFVAEGLSEHCYVGQGKLSPRKAANGAHADLRTDPPTKS